MPATAYFGRICRLLQHTRATDAAGGVIPFDHAAEQAAGLMLETGARQRKILLVGNGGSASIAGHMEMDLCNRANIRAVVFNDPPVITALANDHGYITAYQRLIDLHADAGDLLIAISSSGQSENILRAARAARARDCRLITFSGFEPDNPLHRLGDLNFYVASSHYGEVEVAHHGLGHFLTDRAVEEANRKQSPAVVVLRSRC